MPRRPKYRGHRRETSPFPSGETYKGKPVGEIPTVSALRRISRRVSVRETLKSIWRRK